MVNDETCLKIIRWSFPDMHTNLQCGERPALVLFTDKTNWLIAPITTKNKPLPTHCFIPSTMVTGLERNSYVLLEQLFWITINSKNPPMVLGSVRVNKTLKQIRSALVVSLGLKRIRCSKPLHPAVFRGEIYQQDANRYLIVLQNNVGNNYSPTTIVGESIGSEISAIYTMPIDDLSSLPCVGREHNVTKKVLKFFDQSSEIAI